MSSTYTENEIKTLEWNEHIRRRPGMYIGKLGDGSSPDDGIYVLVKEVMDNSIDEYAMGHGKAISVSITDRMVTIRDYGRGIPLGSVVDAASRMNTGAKYDNKAFKKSVGLNGVGIKAVNALSSSFYIQSFRDGESHCARFSKGNLVEESRVLSSEKNGTLVSFYADEELFGNYTFNFEFIESMFRNYSYLNTGLTLKFNDKEFISKNGLLDLLNEGLTKEPLYSPIHLQRKCLRLRQQEPVPLDPGARSILPERISACRGDIRRHGRSGRRQGPARKDRAQDMPLHGYR